LSSYLNFYHQVAVNHYNCQDGDIDYYKRDKEIARKIRREKRKKRRAERERIRKLNEPLTMKVSPDF